MTSTKIIGGSAQLAYIVNVDADADIAARGIKGGAAIPVYVVNLSQSSGGITRLGDYAGGDYTEFEIDGTMVAYGGATCFRDELQSVTAARLTSPSGDFVLNDPECSITAKISARYPTDYVSMNLQLNHDWSLGTAIFPHLHWWQTTTNNPHWVMGYRWQKQGGLKEASWTDEKWTNNAFTWSSGTLNQITSFGSVSAPVGYGQVSDIVQFRLYRDYTNASGKFGGGDPVNASQDFINFDIHIEVDTLGSNEEYIK